MAAAASVRAAASTAVILRNFSNMTRLPRFLFGGEPALGLVVRELRLQTRHKLGNWRSPSIRQRLISRYGKFEDRRDLHLAASQTPTGASAMAMPQRDRRLEDRERMVGVRTTNSNLPVRRKPIARCLVEGGSESRATGRWLIALPLPSGSRKARCTRPARPVCHPRIVRAGVGHF